MPNSVLNHASQQVHYMGFPLDKFPILFLKALEIIQQNPSLPFWKFCEVGLPVLVAVRVVPEPDGHRGERRGAHQLPRLRARLHGVAILIPALQKINLQ